MAKLSNDRCRELTEALRDACGDELPLLPGMLFLDGARVLASKGGKVTLAEVRGNPYVQTMDSFLYAESDTPLDLNDPATVGVLAGYARELWGDDSLHVESVPCECLFRVWVVYSQGEVITDEVHDTRAEAWVDAILRAPGKGARS